MDNIFQSFGVYKKATAILSEDLLLLEGYCEELELKSTSESVRAVRERTAEDAFKIAVVGEFKRGKSTLINGLLGKEILPADPLPCSATLNRITYDVTPHAAISFKDGRVIEIPVEELRNYVTKLTEESAQTAETIQEATVYYPLSYCKNNVDIIDTPGLNDDDNMTTVTLSVIPQVDISIMAIMALSPFGQYEKDFLENKLMASEIGKVLFVVTRMDLVDEEDRERILDHIREEITRHILVKARNLYGEGSEEYTEYVRKLGDVKVIGISPRNALRGKVRNNRELYEESNYPEFEKELERMLLEERGMIQLREQLSKVLSAATEIAKTGELQKNAMQMDRNEFEEKYSAVKEQFVQIRQKRENENKKTKLAAEELEITIHRMLSEYWKELEQVTKEAIDCVEITQEDIKKENLEKTQKRILDQVQKTASNSLQLFHEKAQNQISEAIGKEVGRLGDFEEDFFNMLGETAQEFTSSAPDQNTSQMVGALGNLVSVLATGTVFGGAVGGMYQGYKQAGLQGAVVGGAASLGSVIAVNTALNLLVATAGISLGVLALPLYAAMGIFGMSVGKKTVSAMFGKNNLSGIDAYRSALKDQMKDVVQNMKEEGKLREEYDQQIQELFCEVTNRINRETEMYMTDMENTLETLQKQKIEKQVIDEKSREKLEEILTKTAEISKRAVELRSQL